MIGERLTQAPQKDKLRRLLLLPPLLVSFALGAVSVVWWRDAPATPSPGMTSVPSATAVQPGATPGGSQLVAAATPLATGGGTGVAQIGDGGFTITGNAGNLRPGVATPIQLTLANPNGVPVYVTALTVTVAADSTPPGCNSAGNFQVTQSNASGADPIAIAAKGSVTLASAPRAPQITLLNLPGVNQDICKGKSFGLTYSGSAHS